MAKKYKLLNYLIEAIQIQTHDDTALLTFFKSNNIEYLIERDKFGEVIGFVLKNKSKNTAYARLLDYIVISEQKELLVCSPEVFVETYTENLEPTPPPVTEIHISDVIGLTEIFKGQDNINDISLVDQTYSLAQLMGLLNYENETIYVRKNKSGVSSAQNGYGLTPFHDLKDAFNSLTAERNRIQVLDSSSYTINNMMIGSTVKKFIAPQSTIISNITISSPKAYVEIGDVEGNLTINQDCTLIIKGELKGKITIANGIKPYIRIGRVDEVAYPLTITRDNLLSGSTIGSNQYGMKAL